MGVTVFLYTTARTMGRAIVLWASGLIPFWGQPLNGQHLCALGLERRIDTGIDGLAVDDDRTAATFGFVTADFRAGQS